MNKNVEFRFLAVVLCACAALVGSTKTRATAADLSYTFAVLERDAPYAIYSLDGHVVSASAANHSNGVCFRMHSTAAEPIAGFSSSPSYALNGGFTARRSKVQKDDIFFHGFERCPQ